jgi:hypothetical protein
MFFVGQSLRTFAINFETALFTFECRMCDISVVPALASCR